MHVKVCVLQVSAGCLKDDSAAREACKQLGLRLGGDEYVQKEAYRSLEGRAPIHSIDFALPCQQNKQHGTRFQEFDYKAKLVESEA